MPRKTNRTIINKATGKEYRYARVTATIGKNPDGTPIRKEFVGASKKTSYQMSTPKLKNIFQPARKAYHA